MKKPGPCPQGSTRKKVSREDGSCWELRAALGPAPPVTGAPLSRSPVGIPGSHPGHRLASGDPPSLFPPVQLKSRMLLLLLPLLLLLAGEQQDCEFRICNPNAEPRPTGLQLPRRRRVRGQRRAPAPPSQNPNC